MVSLIATPYPSRTTAVLLILRISAPPEMSWNPCDDMDAEPRCFVMSWTDAAITTEIAGFCILLLVGAGALEMVLKPRVRIVVPSGRVGYPH